MSNARLHLLKLRSFWQVHWYDPSYWRQWIVLYLTVSDGVISTTLVQENPNPNLVYFVSRVLHDSKTRYRQVENVALALLTIDRESFNLLTYLWFLWWTKNDFMVFYTTNDITIVLPLSCLCLIYKFIMVKWIKLKTN